MNLESFTGPGSTPSRRRFWDQVTDAVVSSQKVAGRNVSVDEHSGKGTVINVPDRQRASRASSFDCGTVLSITFSGVVLDCGCVLIDHVDHSAIITDGGAFNDVTQSTVPLPDECSPNCVWEANFDEESIFVHVKRWLASTTCEFDPDQEFDGEIGNLFILRESDGTWNVWVEIYDVLLFYGFGPDPSLIANTLECNSEFTFFDNVVTDCIYDGPLDFTQGSHGGTVSITFL